jgi:hypothetical protein
MGPASSAAHGHVVHLFSERKDQTGDGGQRAARNARRGSAAVVCTAAALSFAAGVAPGIGWALLVVGMALITEALVSR